MNLRMIGRLSLILLLFGIVIANSTAQTSKTWTFLVYFAADNDLEGYALNDISEMIGIGSSDEVNIVIQVDRTQGYDNTWADFSDTRRFYVTQQANLGALRSVEQLGEVDMGTADSLADFIIWGVNTYPAEKYSLIIWSHGGGWNGIGPDYDNNQSMLTIEEINAGISTARQQTGIDPFEFIGFDACLMSQLEVYQALQGHAKYGIAAEEVIPGNGYNYTATLSHLVNNPNTSVENLLTVMIDGYMEFYSDFGLASTFRFFDLHAIDLSALDGLNSALANFISVANANMRDVLNAIGVARVGAQGFSYASDGFEFVDLIDIMTLIEQGAQVPDVQNAAQAVIDAALNSIFYTRTTDNMPGARGMSIYFPILADTFNKDAYIANGAMPALADEWVSFLDTFHTTSDAILANNDISMTVTGVTYLYDEASVLAPPTINFETTGTAIIDLQYLALYQDDEGGQYIVAQSPLAIYIQDAEGNLRSTYPDGEYQSSYTWDVLMSYMDIEGEQVPVLVEYQPRSGQFKLDGVYCWVNDGSCAQASMFFDSTTKEMVSVWVTIETGNGSVTAVVNTNAGDTFAPSLATFTPEGDIQQITLPNTFTFGDIPASFYYAPALSGSYSILIYIRDLTGNIQADVAQFTVNNADMPSDLRGFPEAQVLGVNFAYPITWGESVIQDLGDGNTRYYVSNEDLTYFINLEIYNADSLDDLYANLESFFQESVTILQDPFPFETSTGYSGLAVEYSYGEVGYGYYLLFYENGTGYLFDLYMPEGYDEDVFNNVYSIFDSSLMFFPVE